MEKIFGSRSGEDFLMIRQSIERCTAMFDLKKTEQVRCVLLLFFPILD